MAWDWGSGLSDIFKFNYLSMNSTLQVHEQACVHIQISYLSAVSIYW